MIRKGGDWLCISSFQNTLSTGRERHSGERGGNGHAAHNREMKTRVFLFLMFLHPFVWLSGGMITMTEPLIFPPLVAVSSNFVVIYSLCFCS